MRCDGPRPVRRGLGRDDFRRVGRHNLLGLVAGHLRQYEWRG